MRRSSYFLLLFLLLFAPVALIGLAAQGFRMSGLSWMDMLVGHGYDCYGLDFPGYGYSDRYADNPLESSAYTRGQAEQGTHVLHLEKNRQQLYLETLQFLNQPTMSTNAHAIAVIFEVIPNEGKKQEYLDIAAELKSELIKIDGFISIERFQSLSDPGKILSLSFWRDEEAILQWRNLEVHRVAQAKGREYIFKDYHLRIADVVRDYSLFDRKEAPVDSKEYHHTPQ
jgi:heme-degrading monooxygenase HmoA